MNNDFLTDSRTLVIGKGHILAIGTCVECGREFDPMDDQDVDEWFNGHDCEPDYEPSTCVLCDEVEMHDHSADEYGSFSSEFFEDHEMRSIR